MADASSIVAIRRVRDYYDKSHRIYRWFYIDKDSLGIHYGFWAGANSKSEAIINQYREISRLLKPTQGDLILDGGCSMLKKTGNLLVFLFYLTYQQFFGIE